MTIVELFAKNDKKLWKKAENDKLWTIRQQAYRQTNNWKKAENDEEYSIRLEAYQHTHNWKKAKNDENWINSGIAQEILKLKGEL